MLSHNLKKHIFFYLRMNILHALLNLERVQYPKQKSVISNNNLKNIPSKTYHQQIKTQIEKLCYATKIT